MKIKQLLLLALAAAILIGLAIQSTKRQSKSAITAIGGKALPGLDVNDINAIDIVSPTATANVARVDGIWHVSNHFNYPADFGKIRDLLTKLADLKVLQAVRATKQQRRELHLVTGPGTDAGDQPTVIDLKDAAGKSQATLLLGKERMRQSPNPEPSPYGDFPDGRFLATGKGDIFLVGDTLSEAVTSPRAWMDEEFISVKPEDIAYIEVSGTTNGAVVLSRPVGGKDFVLPHVPKGKEADESKLTRLTSALNYIRFEDVADPATTVATMGLDKPVSFVARTFKGETYNVTLGHSAAPDSKYYARFSVSFAPPPAPDGAAGTNQAAKVQAEQNDKLAADTQRLSAKLAPWTYQLDTYAAESLAMGFGDLLKDEPKPEEKKAEAPAKSTP